MIQLIAVDDEPRALKDINETLKEALPECELASFTSPIKALNYVKENPIDVAFLDIEMGKTNGIVLAKQMKNIQPDIHIIFVTSFDKYAMDAIHIHATGYLMKPALVEDILREMTFLYKDYYSEKETRIRVQTFGGFAVYVNGNILHFKRSKSKELLAYLVDRRGLSITIREACNILFEDGKYTISRKNYFQTIISELQSDLKKAGAEKMLIKKRNSFSINPSVFDCDSYRFIDGDPIAINNYRRDYMICYSWAEFTMGLLETISSDKQ